MPQAIIKRGQYFICLCKQDILQNYNTVEYIVKVIEFSKKHVLSCRLYRIVSSDQTSIKVTWM